MLTQAIEDYLKVIYKLEQSGEAVTTTAIADRMGVALASVSNMVKKLTRLKLVEHTPYRQIRLTAGGQKVALEVIRHHRLIELYLSRMLGMSLDRVDEEAERLEHVLSEDLEDKIAESLGDPTRDPHGDPIPARDGTIDDLPHPVLADLAVGMRGVIVRVSDRDPAILRELAASGMLPGTAFEILSSTKSGSLRVRAGDSERMISSDHAKSVFVTMD
ncbi:MAG TPA: metal-dependent transcriptional regulator [Thermoanaerobaculia bacterium]|nr:metal-dependent transcriptional regulator [Thermoanaerobaculia bacterium]